MARTELLLTTTPEVQGRRIAQYLGLSLIHI